MPSLFQSLSQLPLLSSLFNLSPNRNNNINNHNGQSLNPHPVPFTQQCPYPSVRSCPFPPPRDINTCCVNHPSGHFLQTQFWDTSPALGAPDSWTIHGLWPDLCTGGFDQFCDSSRRHDDIPAALKAAAPPELSGPLLAFMNEYWLSLDGDNAHLWAHEWNKHGTCISTLEPTCYADDDDDDDDASATGHDHRHGQTSGHSTVDRNYPDVLDYIIQTTSLFKTLDTYTLLADAGIVPSTTATYTLRELEDAMETSAHGVPVTFRCNRFGELDEVWYHFAVMGSLRTELRRGDGGKGSRVKDVVSAPLSDSTTYSPFLNESAIREIFIPTAPDGVISNCPRQGIKYRPKSTGHKPGWPPAPTGTRSLSTTATATATAAPFSGKGHLKVHVLDDPAVASSPSGSTPTSTSPSLDALADKDEGCLIRLGDWYTSGTCATFKAQRDIVDPGHAALFSLSSSYSPCLIDGVTGKFECTKSSAVQSIFSSDPERPVVLSYRNSTVFYASHNPRRFEKVGIYADQGDDGSRKIPLEIHWIPT
ncbi:hypothetical protein A1O1_02998 [Capronia coronata CBS 617.96]|uniref:Ribonuclease T2-like n=1 Tax=Capronia coronata CBS 617.96 TaxID=1182541 RepID=W9YNT9_9EURO|nr:uncharacterized protein A1O1_02998 [Capronia coronata CBS 617.96]EXJ94602.1 hypothetical protein A1O1_02998 [Capronia coronata CBS 617.96]